MAKKSATRLALERGVVTTAADARRLEDVYRLTARVLLEDDARVQAAYQAFEQHVNATDPRLFDSLLCVELSALVTLVRQLGVSRYTWLPGALFWEFCRVIGTEPINVELPRDVVATLDRGRAPKHGETHHEDLERNIRWWYRRKIKTPPDNVTTLAVDYVEQRRAAGINRTSEANKDVRDGIARIETLLACVFI